MHPSVVGECLAWAWVMAAPCQAAAGERLPQHTAAVAASRAGDPGQAWALIQEARRLRSDDPEVLADYLTLGAWGGHQAEVLPLARTLALATLPLYTLEALGRAARDAKDPAFSLRCYNEALRRQPDRAQAHQGRLLAALAAGQHETAAQYLKAVPLALQEHPDFCAVRMALAEAWLKRSRPSRALPEFQAVLRAVPGDPEATLGCFWALLDQGRWREARGLARANAARLAPAGAAASPAALKALRLEAQALGYTEALAQAEARLQALHSQYPADGATLEALALVWRFRGQPRRAVAALSLGAQAAPEQGWTWLSLAAAQRELHAFAEEAASLAKAAERMPESPGLAQAQRESGQARAGRFTLEAQDGRARDAAPTAPTGSWDQTLQARAESAVLAEHWRLQGQVARERTFLEDGPLDRVRGALAAAYAAPLGQAEWAVGSQNRGLAGDPGQGTLLFHGTLTPQDALCLELTLARNSGETPLKAWNAGIRGQYQALNASWRWSEGQAWRGGLSTLALSDSNRRDSAWTSLEQRLSAWGPHVLTASAGVWLTRNTLAPALAPYFDPGRDRSLELEVGYTGPLWQEGSRGLRHQAHLGGGSYQEQGFGTRATFAASYRLQWHLGRGLEGYLGVGYRERPYDGVSNRRAEVQFGCSGRLP